jgi:hypothetical protein
MPNQLSQNDPNAFTNPNQNFGATQAQIALQQQMAKQMLADSGNVQFANVTPGGSVRGAGGGSVPAGGWVVPNKYAGVQALGDKLAGLYMAKQAGQNQANSNQAAMQALQSVMGGGQGNAGDSSASTPQAPPTDIAAPTDQGSTQAPTPVPGINPNGSQAIPQSPPQSQPQPQGNPAQKVASAYVQPTNPQQLSTLMRLAQAPGVTGQLAASMLSKQLSPPDPALVNAALAERKSTDPNNAGAVANLNSLEQLARMPISSADALRGEKNTDSEKATIADTQSQTQFRNGPQTQKEMADAAQAAAEAATKSAGLPYVAPKAAADIASSNASTAASLASTGKTNADAAMGVGNYQALHQEAIAKGQAENTQLQSLKAQTQGIQQIADHIAGVYGAGSGAVDKFLSNNNESATDKQLLKQFLSNQRLQSIAGDEAGTGAKGPNAALYNGYAEHGLDQSSTPDALKTMGSLMEQALNNRINFNQGAISAHQDALKQVGKTDLTPSGTAPPSVALPNGRGTIGGPNASPQMIRVTSPNGQTGTIPASQLQAALASGYKQAQ